jgi:hypothetical protein
VLVIQQHRGRRPTVIKSQTGNFALKRAITNNGIAAVNTATHAHRSSSNIASPWPVYFPSLTATLNHSTNSA